jgi:uncharacterized protein (TIGR03382 family)
MRVTLLAAVLSLSAGVADAETFKRPIVWKNRVIEAEQPTGGAIALTNVSRKLYLNDCMPSGCAVSPGTDSSLLNRSSIPDTATTLSAYPHGTEHWNKLVQCVKDTFAPFTIEVLTVDPGTVEPHFEVMIGGSDTQLHPQLSAGGVAPYVSCNAQRSNGLSFVFPETTNSLNYLCGAVVQEAMHVWGLDHELDAKDPMTYLELGSLKRFQNNDADCGEELSDPRRCRCGTSSGVPSNPNKQNSFRYMINTFGLNPSLAAPTLEITTPREGGWVKPGFPIGAIMTSPLEAISAEIKIDSTVAATLDMAPFVVNAPASVTAGPHAITVTGADAGDRTVTATVNVNVMASCANGAKCAGGTHCLGDLCWPGSNVDGGLGADCVGNEDCISGSCAMGTEESKCVSQCDAGEKCPSGYECISGANVCYPSASGGCSTNGGSPAFVLLVLGVMALVIRRRRS